MDYIVPLRVIVSFSLKLLCHKIKWGLGAFVESKQTAIGITAMALATYDLLLLSTSKNIEWMYLKIYMKIYMNVQASDANATSQIRGEKERCHLTWLTWLTQLAWLRVLTARM